MNKNNYKIVRNRMRKARKELEAVGKNFPHKKINLFVDYHYYWQAVTYLTLLDLKN